MEPYPRFGEKGLGVGGQVEGDCVSYEEFKDMAPGILLVSEMHDFPRKMTLHGVDQNECLEFITEGLNDTRSQETFDIKQSDFAMAAIVEDLA
jgi:hypothetical protein